MFWVQTTPSTQNTMHSAIRQYTTIKGTLAGMYTCIHTYMHTYMHTYRHIRTYLQVCACAYFFTYIYININYRYTYAYIYIYIYTYTHTHTYTFTYKQTRLCVCVRRCIKPMPASHIRIYGWTYVQIGFGMSTQILEVLYSASSRKAVGGIL